LRYLQALAAAALAAFYALALILDRAAGILYGLMILLGLSAIVCRQRVDGISFSELLRRYWPLALAMAAPLIAVMANEISRGHFTDRSIDAPSRLALFPLALWAVWLVPLPRLRQLHWAFIAGVLLSTIKVYKLSHGGEIRYLTDFIPITIFIEMAMLLGVYGLFSLAWDTRRDKALIALKLLAAAAILYGSYLSKSRGAWITIPLFAAIAFVSARSIRTSVKLMTAVALTIALALAANHSVVLKERYRLAQEDIREYAQGTNVDTSIGTRFQLWRGSLVIFREHPIFGVGVDRYRNALQELAERRIITPMASTFAHSHNEVLFTMARLGAVGLAALLALYLVPASYFMRDLRHEDRQVRGAAGMGLSLCLGILVLGLTDVVFLWWEVFPFYALGIANFITLIAKRKLEIKV
jgi:O-antigen ligase